jgi:hypothetical protein
VKSQHGSANAITKKQRSTGDSPLPIHGLNSNIFIRQYNGVVTLAHDLVDCVPVQSKHSGGSRDFGAVPQQLNAKISNSSAKRECVAA